LVAIKIKFNLHGFTEIMSKKYIPVLSFCYLEKKKLLHLTVKITHALNAHKLFYHSLDYRFILYPV